MMTQSAAAKTTSSYRDVLRVSMPLVISMTTTVVMTFTDRVFLANYSIDAIATVFSWTSATLLLGLFVFARENDSTFKTWKNHHFDADLFRRLLRYGVPSSLQFSLDVLAFGFFVLKDMGIVVLRFRSRVTIP